MEQVKGPPELRQRIIVAAKEARKNEDYPIELQNPDCPYITEKYTDHANKILPPSHGPYPTLERKKNHNICFVSVIKMSSVCPFLQKIH